jgi:hypothetical protein
VPRLALESPRLPLGSNALFGTPYQYKITAAIESRVMERFGAIYSLAMRSLSGDFIVLLSRQRSRKIRSVFDRPVFLTGISVSFSGATRLRFTSATRR